MNMPAVCRVNILSVSPQCSSCCYNRLQPLLSSPSTGPLKHSSISFPTRHFLRFVPRNKGSVVCRSSETETEPDKNDDKDENLDEEADGVTLNDSVADKSLELNSRTDQDKDQTMGMLENTSLENNNGAQVNEQPRVEDGTEVQVASGSPLPGVKPLQLDESIRIPKETIEILRNQVFGFDTFFVTSQEPYEGGVLFKGNLRGQAATAYEKASKRMQDRLGDVYKLFLLNNPEDDKPVAVVVPRMTLQPETTAVPEWFAAGAFGLVTVFTLLLRNVPALQSNLLSVVDNLDLLKDGLPGALITAFVLGVHEVSHLLVAKEVGVKLGVPYFVPSWQIGSFGAITRIVNIVPKREDLLKVAAAGPLAGFSVGLILLLSGFILPPTDGIGIIVDPSVFHESFLAGGIAKLLLGDALKEGTPISVNPLVIWAWAGLLINAINSIPAGELDGGRIAFAMWGRKASARLSSLSIGLLGISALFSDVAFYWVVLIFFLQRGPIAPLSEEITDPDNKYIALGVVVLLLGLLVCLPYPFLFSNEAATGF
ncbi:PREDICTED: probable zinc metalloprotease EGY2, chloroplastic isoform X2 [Nicotiana attenuata]|uniref:Zinc metalloprotease egy2, chloroplastic n=1 Tax=Nicotiana attenuata TaxID=49451 RepID=A0A1J6JSL7_NICAT|nr:PREDICTED: probable zinc metalloprotease EGY2, chloroplastic isoform X2 [Nicotiana attenuata]OIT19516.1 putative zinc metalloprotease egy2, chloroplastic [Nicotiana attenuata]